MPLSGTNHLAADWTAPRLRVLEAIVARVLEGAPEAESAAPLVAAEVRRRIGSLRASKQRDLLRALDLLDKRVTGLATIGRPVGFAQASAAQQGEWLWSWAQSRVPQLRTGYQAFRRLALGAHYSTPAVSASIGYLGPFHTRDTAVPWEGSMPNGTGAMVASVSPIARGQVDHRRKLPATTPPTGVVTGAMVDRDRHRSADVVVIGSGAGGAVAAARLAEAGLEVVILEAGKYVSAADFTEQEAPLAELLYADGALRATDDLAVQLLQGTSVGGSTTINWMIMLRTPDFVLDEWQRRSGLHDYTSAVMGAAFARVEREVNAQPVPDEAHSPNNRVILDGARQLGWRAATAIINAKGCVRSGFCGIGCRYDAKQGTLLTYIPRALALGATLYSDARVDRIEMRERDSGTGPAPIKRVHAVVQTGGTQSHQLTIDAPLVVIAGGAVGTPVLLQRSGLGGGGVGRFLRLHPTTATVGVFDRDIFGSSGLPLSTMCDEHLQWQQSNFGFWLECPPFLPGLGAVAVSGFGPSHANLMRQFTRLSSVIALTRDGAEVDRSSGGVQAQNNGDVSIHYELAAADALRVQASIEAAARLQLAAGAREVHTLHAKPIVVRNEDDLLHVRRAPVSANRLTLFSAHVNGTCRMGTNARTAGCTPEGERFGARGVFVADGSLLPTALGVNPQSTIMALATIVSERIAARYVSAHHPQREYA